MSHKTHCNQGEYRGSCKYGEEDICPAFENQRALDKINQGLIDKLRETADQLEKRDVAVMNWTSTQERYPFYTAEISVRLSNDFEFRYYKN